MTFSIIQKSQLEGMQRIDAEYFQPYYLDLENKLNSIKTVSLGDISAKIINFGAYSLCNYIEWQENGVPYLNVGNIKEGFIDYSNVKYIDEQVHEILLKSAVKEGDIVMPMAGSIGNVAVADNVPEKLNSNQAIAKITVKKEFSSYFVAAFLESRFGHLQITREIVSSVQANIFLFQIREFKIPVISYEKQLEVEKIYKNGFEKLYDSKKLYQQAEDLLLEELGLKNFDEGNDLFSIVQYRDIVAASRNDSEYFQPKYLRLEKKIKDKSQPLSKLIQNVPAKFEPAKEPDKEFKYVELANINSANGLIDGYETVLGREAPSRAKRILQVGDVIVSSVEGSLDKVALVTKDQDGYLASTGFFQFRSNKFSPEVLLVLMKSIVMQWQLKQHCAGTILTAVSGEALNKMYILIIPQPIQQKITDLVHKSHVARQKSKELLEQAKKKVEDMIEKRN